jgi:hypothetical protein
VIGRPSSQCAWSGQAATTRSNVAGFRSAFSGASRVDAKSVTDQVELSPGRVRTEKLPTGASCRPIRRGSSGPVKYRV